MKEYDHVYWQFLSPHVEQTRFSKWGKKYDGTTIAWLEKRKKIPPWKTKIMFMAKPNNKPPYVVN